MDDGTREGSILAGGERDREAQSSYLVPSHVDLGKAALSDLLVNNKLADVAAARLARAA